MQPIVGIVMGSDSDLKVMRQALDTLHQFGVPFEVRVASAHRTPDEALQYAESARDRGLRVLIAGAGAAAHLAGVLAAKTTLPVIGVPINATALQGEDALLAMVQMPAGVPVAVVAIDGAANAALLAIQMLALADEALAEKLAQHKRAMARKVHEKNEKLQQALTEFFPA